MKRSNFENITISVLLLFLSLSALSCTPQKSAMDELKQKRHDMLEGQIAARGIENKAVLNAMLTVERHLFVPKKLIKYAYADRPLPIGYQQTISQPYIVAFMTEQLKLQPHEKVLEIGTGSGYQAAVLGEICDSVYTIEIVKPLGERAAALLDSLGYDNVHVKIGDGYQGWTEQAPFDAIIVTCAPLQIPQPLKDQLKEGGRIIIPVGVEFNQNLVLMKKVNNSLRQKASIPVRFVPMVDEKGKIY